MCRITEARANNMIGRAGPCRHDHILLARLRLQLVLRLPHQCLTQLGLVALALEVKIREVAAQG